MSETVSSAIKLVAGILIVALLVAFGFSTVQSQKTNGNKALNNIEKMNTTLDEADLTQYDGATLAGSQVVEAVKAIAQKDGVVAIVNNGKKVEWYGNSPAIGEVTETVTESADVPSGPDTVIPINSTAVKLISQKKYTSTYITPSQSFIGTVHRDASTGAIIAVAFDSDKSKLPTTAEATAEGYVKGSSSGSTS